MKLRSVLILLYVISCSLLLGCSYGEQKASQEVSNEVKVDQIYPEMLINLTNAHHLDKFNQFEVIAFDIELYFRNKLRLKGSIYSMTNSSKVLVKKEDGTHLLFDGEEVYIKPDSSNVKGARFDALTWSYFALAPFKFKDEGTNWKVNDSLPLTISTNKQPTLKLTFGDGVGDAPDDWYIIFQNEENQYLEALAYIVTFGNTPQEEAEQNPHAIMYSDYEEIEGIPLAKQWSFHNYSFENGLSDQLGEATLSNYRFIKATDSLFARTSDYQLVPLP